VPQRVAERGRRLPELRGHRVVGVCSSTAALTVTDSREPGCRGCLPSTSACGTSAPFISRFPLSR
jgi:hypothetical protein